jgi:UDP-3-O-[3-hydroxymyristoyl] glucosamine N-acyltransferase
MVSTDINVVFGDNVIIHPGVLFVRPDTSHNANFNDDIFVGNGAVIRSGSVIYSGCRIGEGSVIDHFCIVRERATIGFGTRIMNYTEVGADVVIGDNCRVRGFLCNRTVIGNGVSSFGRYIHAYALHDGGFIEPSPVVGDDAVIGDSALIVGGVTVPAGSFIKAGSLISKPLKISS